MWKGSTFKAFKVWQGQVPRDLLHRIHGDGGTPSLHFLLGAGKLDLLGADHLGAMPHIYGGFPLQELLETYEEPDQTLPRKTGKRIA